MNLLQCALCDAGVEYRLELCDRNQDFVIAHILVKLFTADRGCSVLLPTKTASVVPLHQLRPGHVRKKDRYQNGKVGARERLQLEGAGKWPHRDEDAHRNDECCRRQQGWGHVPGSLERRLISALVSCGAGDEGRGAGMTVELPIGNPAAVGTSDVATLAQGRW